MNPNTLAVLIQATVETRCIAVRYRDQHQVRVVEPHVVYCSKEGTIVAEGFQLRGTLDSTIASPSWVTLLLNNIDSIFILNTNFTPRIADGFLPDKPEYHINQIAIVNTSKDYHTKKPKNGPDTLATFFSRTQRLWWQAGTTLDRIFPYRNLNSKQG